MLLLMMNQKKIESLLGYEIEHFDFFTEAFTHKSFFNENPNSPHNERLEFLGDAVLELVVTDFLFAHFPDAPEGKMTKIRSAIVKTDSLGSVARSLGLGKFLRMSRGETANHGSEKTPILANVFEAVVGALYRDGGFTVAQRFVEKNLFPKISEVLEYNLHLDPKSAFQELAQEKWEKTPLYCILSESGPDHEKIFLSGVFVGEEKMGEGRGSSKQKAEIAAAENALIQQKSKKNYTENPAK